MPPPEISPQSKNFEEIVLGIVVGLFLALGVAYIAYPAFYYRHHPRPMWPIHPVASGGWAASPSLAYFFFAGITAFFGFWQTRVSRWFGRESSRILSWLFLLSSRFAIAGSWKYALAIRFWTLSTVNELYTAMPSMRIAGTLVKWGLQSSIAVVLLNFGYALFHRLHD
jgi:hypothetical protein